MKWQKGKGQMANNDLKNNSQKNKKFSNANSTKTGSELRWPRRVNSSSTTSGARGLILVTIPVIRLVTTTNLTHPLSFVKNILIATVKRWIWWLQLSHYESLTHLLPCSQQPSINEVVVETTSSGISCQNINGELIMGYYNHLLCL